MRSRYAQELDGREEEEREKFLRFREWARWKVANIAKSGLCVEGEEGGGGERMYELVHVYSGLFRTGRMSSLPLSKNGVVCAFFASL